MPDGENGAEMQELQGFKFACPSCGKEVDRVDGEYARHYVGGETIDHLCVMSKREIPAS